MTSTRKQGIPQGSKVGPLLFLINADDILNVPDSLELRMYVDDTNVYFM